MSESPLYKRLCIAEVEDQMSDRRRSRYTYPDKDESAESAKSRHSKQSDRVDKLDKVDNQRDHAGRKARKDDENRGNRKRGPGHKQAMKGGAASQIGRSEMKD